MNDKLRGMGAMLTTIFIFVILLWWLVVVGRHITEAPVVDKAGVVILDVFQRTKDILLVILPLATTAVGFWLGNQGTNEAQKIADKATEATKEATAETERLRGEVSAAKDQLLAMVDVAPSGLLRQAQDIHPDMFDSMLPTAADARRAVSPNPEAAG